MADPEVVRRLEPASDLTDQLNALLERRGVPTALVTNRGLGDVLEIGTQERPDLFDLKADQPPERAPLPASATSRPSLPPSSCSSATLKV